MDSPKVTVIITAYNSGKYLKNAIESVLNQTYSDLECIIVDDGSTDRTGEIASSYQEIDTRVKYFYKENGGEASAKNYGIEKAKGEWITVLDADDWISRNKIEAQLKAAERHRGESEYILIYSDYEILYENNEGHIYKKNRIVNGELSKEQILHKILGRRFGLNTPTPITLNSMLLSRNIFEKFKLNENMPNIADLELYYRMLQEDVKCIYVPIISMYYRQHNDNNSKDSRRSLIGYIILLETIWTIRKEDLLYFPNVHKLIQKAVIHQEYNALDRILNLLVENKVPVYSRIGGVEFNVRNLVLGLSKINLLIVATKITLVPKKLKRKILSLFTVI